MPLLRYPARREKAGDRALARNYVLLCSGVHSLLCPPIRRTSSDIRRNDVLIDLGAELRYAHGGGLPFNPLGVMVVRRSVLLALSILVALVLLAGCGGGGGVPNTGGGGDPRLPRWWHITDFSIGPKQIGDILHLTYDGHWEYYAVSGGPGAVPALTQPDGVGTWGATSTKINFRTTQGWSPDPLDGVWEYHINENLVVEMMMERDYEDEHITLWLEETD